MPVRQAQRLCPDLILLPPNPRLYARASRALHEILRIYAPVIEPRGYGHAFLDLTGTGRLFGPPRTWPRACGGRCASGSASGLGRRGQQQAGESGGHQGGQADGRAGGQRIAAVGTRRRRAGISRSSSVEVLPELDPRMRRRLDDYQLDLIGEVAVIPESALCAVFGGAGRTLRARARGIDPRPVLPPERQAEFHVAHALTTDTNDLGVLYPLLRL